MPTISRFYGIVIAMYFDDHGFQHFHARHAGASAKVRFDQIDVLDRMRGPVFAGALTTSGFSAVSVDEETGTLVWPGGTDLAPDTLYDRRGVP